MFSHIVMENQPSEGFETFAVILSYCENQYLITAGLVK